MSGRGDIVNIHGTGLFIDGFGLLLRGPSGAGKSLLALELLEWAALGHKVGLLVADDRLELHDDGERLMMAAPETIAGMLELRGRGIVMRPFVRSAPVDAVVDLVETLERMPEPDAFATELLGRPLARCPVPRRGVVDGTHQRLLVLECLSRLHAEGTAGRPTRKPERL